MRKLCIFKPDGAGDLILAAGAIRLATEYVGAVNLALVVSDQSAAAARFLFPGVHIVTIPLMGNSVVRMAVLLLTRGQALRSARAETMLSLRHQRTAAQEILLSKLSAGASFGLANVHRFFSPLYPPAFEHVFSGLARYPTASAPGMCLELEAHRTTMELFFRRRITLQEVIPRLTHAECESSGILVSPFAGGPLRDLPVSMLQPVLTRLARRYAEPIDFVCAPRDESRMRSLLEVLARGGVQAQWASTPTFAEFYARVARSRAIFTTDTSTAHLATALDKPTVAILGGAHYGYFGPWRRSARQLWLTSEMDCFGCNWSCKYPSPLCISDVRPDAIVSAFESAIAASGESTVAEWSAVDDGGWERAGIPFNNA